MHGTDASRARFLCEGGRLCYFCDFVRWADTSAAVTVCVFFLSLTFDNVAVMFSPGTFRKQHTVMFCVF